MSDKVARLGIERDNDLMYYLKNGDVWAVPRKKPGEPKGKARKIAATGLDMDYSRYLYFVDGDGDVARKERAHGGGKRAKAHKAPKVPKASKAIAAAPTRTSGGRKTRAELQREIDECVASKPSDLAAHARRRR